MNVVCDLSALYSNDLASIRKGIKQIYVKFLAFKSVTLKNASESTDRLQDANGKMR